MMPSCTASLSFCSDIMFWLVFLSCYKCSLCLVSFSTWRLRCWFCFIVLRIFFVRDSGNFPYSASIKLNSFVNLQCRHSSLVVEPRRSAIDVKCKAMPSSSLLTKKGSWPWVQVVLFWIRGFMYPSDTLTKLIFRESEHRMKGKDSILKLASGAMWVFNPLSIQRPLWILTERQLSSRIKS